VGACTPGAGLGGASTHFIQTFKNVGFLKCCRITAASRDPPQKPPLASSS